MIVSLVSYQFPEVGSRALLTASTLVFEVGSNMEKKRRLKPAYCPIGERGAGYDALGI